jgi:CubicO group peptidase (beta-lactamase class C family)
MPRLNSNQVDHAPVLGPEGLPDTAVFDASTAAKRQRVVNFAAKRFTDMMFVTGLSEETARRHFRLRGMPTPGGLSSQDDDPTHDRAVAEAWAAGHITIAPDPSRRRVTVTWAGEGSGPPTTGHAMAAPGYGGILLGADPEPGFDPRPLARPAAPTAAWPAGDGGTASHPSDPALEAAAAELLKGSPGLHGVLVCTPGSIMLERYGAQGAADRPTPSWSMTKAVTATLIGRLLQEGWLRTVHDPAPAPLWRDPRAIHRLITLDHLLRMRSGLGFPARDETGAPRLVFENTVVYSDAGDAFEAAQRALVATIPGSVYRYVNTGINVLGAILRDQIEARGLPYHETVYALLVDRIGMASYQHSADRTGNFIASGSGAAVLRDYARFGLLYAQDGVWNGERLLPEAWVDYALTPSHTGSHYAACFRTNADGTFPSLPRSAAWASGASDQRVIILREHGLVIAVANETDHPMDLRALDRLGAAAIAQVTAGGALPRAAQ